MSKLPIRVLCVDDHAFLADGLEARLSTVRDIEFVGWIESADRLLETAEERRPHVVLLDIEMPGADPFETLGELQKRFPEVRVIMFSAYIRDHYIDQAVTRGAWGYLSKSDSPDDVIDAIRRVERGEFAFSRAVRERMQAEPESTVGGGRGRVGGGSPASRLELLTPRELQILKLIGRGMSRGEISRELHRSPKTIDNHRAAIMEKLDIHDTVELARFAIREGLVEA